MEKCSHLLINPSNAWYKCNSYKCLSVIHDDKTSVIGKLTEAVRMEKSLNGLTQYFIVKMMYDMGVYDIGIIPEQLMNDFISGPPYA